MNLTEDAVAIVTTSTTPSVVVSARVPRPAVLLVGQPAVAIPAAATYSYHQATPSAQWLVVHGLGMHREPVVLLDDDPETPVLADIAYPSLDSVLITFPEPVTGWAHL